MKIAAFQNKTFRNAFLSGDIDTNRKHSAILIQPINRKETGRVKQSHGLGNNKDTNNQFSAGIFKEDFVGSYKGSELSERKLSMEDGQDGEHSFTQFNADFNRSFNDIKLDGYNDDLEHSDVEINMIDDTRKELKKRYNMSFRVPKSGDKNLMRGYLNLPKQQLKNGFNSRWEHISIEP